MYCKVCGNLLEGSEQICKVCGAENKRHSTEDLMEEGSADTLTESSESKGSAPERRPGHVVGLKWNVHEFPSENRKTEDIDFDWNIDHMTATADSRNAIEQAAAAADGRSALGQATEAVDSKNASGQATVAVDNNNASGQIAVAVPAVIQGSGSQETEDKGKQEVLEPQNDMLTNGRTGEAGSEDKVFFDGIEEEREEFLAGESLAEKLPFFHNAMSGETKAVELTGKERFFTFNVKNAEFQKLLDKEYERLKRFDSAAGTKTHLSAESAAGTMTTVQAGSSAEIKTQEQEGNVGETKVAELKKSADTEQAPETLENAGEAQAPEQAENIVETEASEPYESADTVQAPETLENASEAQALEQVTEQAEEENVDETEASELYKSADTVQAPESLENADEAQAPEQVTEQAENVGATETAGPEESTGELQASKRETVPTEGSGEISISETFDAMDKEREDWEEKTQKKNRAQKTVMTVLLIVLLIIVGIYGIWRFAPDSLGALLINKAIEGITGISGNST